MEVVEGVAGEEDHHDDQEEQGEENAEAEGQHDEHDEDGECWSHPLQNNSLTTHRPLVNLTASPAMQLISLSLSFPHTPKKICLPL